MSIRMTVLSAALCAAAVAAPPLADRPGFKDHALFTRMPNYYLSLPVSMVEKPFDGLDFPVQDGKRFMRQRVEGHYWKFKYQYDETAGAVPSPLQIVRNYEAAAKRIGGKVMFTANASTTVMVARGGKETWGYLVALYQGKQYDLVIIERELMKQDVVANADALKDGLAQNGHVEVPGIFFDTAKAEIKPESEPALAELAKLLQVNAALKVWVVGHTDSVGTEESNVALSTARATSVMKNLIGRGIPAARLTARGAGPLAPVASNATEEGRARNRRVEVVAR